MDKTLYSQLAAINTHLIMKDKILKDIRYYESDKPNIEGLSMPGSLGRIFTPTKETNYIGQRIARKLNELKYSLGACDHVYINLTTVLNEGQIETSNRNINKAIKYIDFGVNQSKFNALTDEQKNDFLQSSTIDIFRTISNDNNLMPVNETARQLLLFGTEMTIHYKTKETQSYHIDIYYQIAPKNSYTKAIVEYQDKKINARYRATFRLQFYDDIYPLVDTITVKDDTIILNPKKSFRADLYNERYKTPIELKFSSFEKF